MPPNNTAGSKSLKRTLNTQIGIVVLIVGFIIGILFFLFSFQMDEKKFQNDIRIQTKHLADTFTQQLWLFDHNTSQLLADLAVESPGITALRIRDHHKNIIIESGPFSDTKETTIVKPLRHDGETLVGYIDINFVNDTWKEYETVIIISGLSMMGLIIIISYLSISSILNRHLVRPLERLQKDMTGLTSGTFKRSEIKGQKTEIQNIIDRFNRMASALADREASQKRVEKQLSKEKNFMEALIDTLPGLFYVYEDGSLIRWNRNFEIVAGLTQEEMTGRSFEEWVVKEDKVRVVKTMNEAMELGGTSIEVNLRFKKEPVPYLLTATNLCTDRKNFILGVGIDLTNRKELEKALHHAQKMESIGTLAGGIAHDFNNILFPLLGYADMLREDLSDTPLLKKKADEILKAGNRAKNLVQQILTLSRKNDQEYGPLRIQSILKEAVELLRASIPKTIKIEIDIDQECDFVVADATQIHQIIMNLSTNAYHSMQDSGGLLKIALGQVEITGTPEERSGLKPGNYACLEIVDTGTGIEESAMDKIFDPYFTTKKTGKGTGLGLSIVRGIAQNCNGDVAVDSKVGRGTQVRVYLPVARSGADAPAPVPNHPLEKGTGRILVVDDEEAIAFMEKSLLERLGYEVTAVVGSKNALSVFERHPDQYDLMITDMTMPDMTGLQLAEKIRYLRPGLPVIICSGFSEQINSKTIEENNIQGYLAKPMEKIDIARTLEGILTASRENN